MEKVLLAAIRKDGWTYVGKRHSDIFNDYVPFGELKGGEQGFVTDKRLFVTREEATKVAFESGQIKYQKKMLFSEDLY